MRRIVNSIAGLTLLFAALDTYAVTWSEQGTVPATLQYETNPNLSSSNYNAVWRFISSPGIKISAVKELDTWNTDFTLRVERSTDKAELKDREDPTVNIGWKHEFEKGEFGIIAHYDVSSSRSSVLLDTGLVVPNDGNQITKSIAVHWQRALNEKMSLTLDGNSTKYSYSGVKLPGNITNSINAKMNYSWSDRVTPFISASYSRFQPDGGGDDTNSITGMLGVNWSVSDRWAYGLSWGLNNTSAGNSGITNLNNSSTGSSNATEWQGGAKVNYTGERSTSSLEYSRSTGPSGASSSVSQDELMGHWSYRLTELASAGADFSLTKNFGNNSAENRDIIAWYGRELSSSWYLRLNCEYKQNKTNFSSANDKVLGATITYTTPNF